MSHIRTLFPNGNLPYKNRLCMSCYGFAYKLIPVPASRAEAIRWYRRAQAAGHPCAADTLQTLRT